MIKEEDIKVGFVFGLPYKKRTDYDRIDDDGCERHKVYVTEIETVLGMYQKFESLSVPLWKVMDITGVRVVIQDIHSKNKQRTCVASETICENGIYAVAKKNSKKAQQSYEEGEIALRYMNEQRIKAIATEGSRLFESITNKMLATYKAKNHDYGNAFSEMYDELGINYGYGKIREKVNRIKVLKDNKAQVENEPLEDAILDCANYCILTLMEYQKRKKDGK